MMKYEPLTMPKFPLTLALLLATVVRCLSWPATFSADGIHYLVDGDPYYHVIRATTLAVDHSITWFDQALNYPFGATVLWPPLFDALIAFPAWLVGAGHPSLQMVQISAAIVPLVIGVAGVAVGAALATEFIGSTGGIIAAFLLALLPMHARYSALGRPDQHVLESLLLSLLILTYLRGMKNRRFRWRYPIGLGLVITASFWTWVGSAFHLVVLSLLVAAAFLLPEQYGGSKRGLRIVGAGSVIASMLLFLAALLFGPAGCLKVISLQGISSFQIILTAAIAGWCGTLLAAEHFRSSSSSTVVRLVELAAAALVIAAALWFGSADLRAALQRGLLALNRGNEWYKYVNEIGPLMFAPNTALSTELRNLWTQWGLTPLLTAAGFFAWKRAWQAEPEERPKLVILVLYGAIFAFLLLYMSRFAYYSVVPLAIVSALGASCLANRLAAKLPAVSGSLVVAVMGVLPCLGLLLPPSWSNQQSRQTAALLSPIRQGLLPQNGSIMGRWDTGHHIRYYSGLPVVASPFGTDGGAGSMEDSSALFLASDQGEAARLLKKRQVHYIMLGDPANAVLESAALLQPAAAPVRISGDRLHGFSIKCQPAYDRLIVARLFYYAGGVDRFNRDSLGSYRLVSEVGPPGGPPLVRLFEVVEGAPLLAAGARPGAVVSARTTLTTPLGSLPWIGTAIADASGHALFRLPYAAAVGGTVSATAYTIDDGQALASVALTERDVREGRRVMVELKAR